MAGKAAPPVYAVYDWFVKHRSLDWQRLFALGLGQIAHAPLLRVEYPHLQIVETSSTDTGGERRDVRWITDAGELHEYFRGEWRQEYIVKAPSDYGILSRALEDSRFVADDDAFSRVDAGWGTTA